MGTEHDGVSTGEAVVGSLEEAGHVASGVASGVDLARAVSEGRGAERVSQVAGNVGGIASAAGGALGPDSLIGRAMGDDAARVVGGVARGVEAASEVVEHVSHTVDALSHGGGGHGPLGEVEASFEVSGSQAAWRVREAGLIEALDAPWEADVLVVVDDEVDTERLLGESASLSMARHGEAPHAARGAVRRVDDLGEADGKRQYRFTVVPRLWLLSLRRDCRIFQDMTTRQVVEAVFDAAGLFAGAALRDWSRVRAELAVREYCVQYQESDLNFVSRLLQEEGVAYYVDARGHDERIVFFDGLAGAPDAWGATGASAYAVRGDEMRTARDESIRHLRWSDRSQSRSVALRDFNFTTATAREAMTRASAESPSQGLDVYEYPGRFTLVDAQRDALTNQQHTYGQHDGQARAAARLGELKRDAHTGRGEGNALAFAAGRRFTATGHGRRDVDGRAMVLTRVEHRYRASDATRRGHEGGAEGEREGYHNVFECVRADGAYRPRRDAARPAIYGTQTAVVTGPDPDAPAGGREEIHCDVHGRIRVRFHWDRAADVADERRSCWIRVAQVWAGAPWGFNFVPRRGTEVVVSFLDGNPDRPLVVGSVYDNENRPAYHLPDERTKSWIRTQSTPGGDPTRFNELSFEDAAHREVVGLRAQRDLVETVLHDHKTTVHHDQVNVVRNNQRENIGVDQSLTVGHNRNKNVHHDEDVHIGRNLNTEILGTEDRLVSGGRATEIHASDMTTVRTWSGLQAGTEVRINTIDGQIETLPQIFLVPAHVTIQQGARTSIQLDGDKITLRSGDARITLGGEKIELDTGHGAVLRLEGDHVQMCSRGGSTQLSLTEKAELHATGAVDIHRTGGASLLLNRDAELRGIQVKLNS